MTEIEQPLAGRVLTQCAADRLRVDFLCFEERIVGSLGRFDREVCAVFRAQPRADIKMCTFSAAVESESLFAKDNLWTVHAAGRTCHPLQRLDPATLHELLEARVPGQS